MTTPDPAAVARASAAWVWVPETATAVETDDYVLVRYPDHFLRPLVLQRVHGSAPAQHVVNEVLDRAAEFGLTELHAWVRLDNDEALVAALESRGGVEVERVDVLAQHVGACTLGALPGEVSVGWVTDVEIAREFEVVNVEVFGGQIPGDDQIRETAATMAGHHAAGTGAALVARRSGNAVGLGGLSIAEPAAPGDERVSRLWGGGVLESERRRGAYRAMLATRLVYAEEQGATLALVKGRVATSGPVLRRAGFAAYGEERCLRVPVETRR